MPYGMSVMYLSQNDHATMCQWPYELSDITAIRCDDDAVGTDVLHLLAEQESKRCKFHRC
jgi:hypothetical protein